MDQLDGKGERSAPMDSAYTSPDVVTTGGSPSSVPGAPPMPSSVPASPPLPPPASTPELRSTSVAPFGSRDWAATGCGALLALLWCVFADPWFLSGILVLAGGVTLTISILGFFAAAIALGGRRAHLSRESAVLLVLVVALACVPAVTMDPAVRCANAFVLAAACMLEYLLLSGCPVDVATSARGGVDALAFFVRSQFAHMLDPIRTITSDRGRSTRRTGSVLLSLLVTIAVLLVVLPLLASADAVFGSVLGDALSWLEDSLGMNVLRVVRYAFVALAATSLLLSLMRSDASTRKLPPRVVRAADPAAVAPLLVVLDLVYLLFAVIQFAYLFGGASAPTMHGGYAEYARSGFFQLVEVAAINLTIVVVTLWARRDAPRSIVVQLAQVVLLGETLVVDASAAWRMGLYVSHYGLSELRAFTYLGMVAIAALALLAVVRVLRPVFPLYRSAMVTLFALWCAFALSGVDRWVVRYNVEGYASGSVHEIDLDYLVDISSDAADELENLSRGLVGSDSVLARRIDEVLDRSGYGFAGEGLFGSFGSELGYRRVEWWQASVPIILRGWTR